MEYMLYKTRLLLRAAGRGKSLVSRLLWASVSLCKMRELVYIQCLLALMI